MHHFIFIQSLPTKKDEEIKKFQRHFWSEQILRRNCIIFNENAKFYFNQIKHIFEGIFVWNFILFTFWFFKWIYHILCKTLETILTPFKSALNIDFSTILYKCICLHYSWHLNLGNTADYFSVFNIIIIHLLHITDYIKRNSSDLNFKTMNIFNNFKCRIGSH